MGLSPSKDCWNVLNRISFGSSLQLTVSTKDYHMNVGDVLVLVPVSVTSHYEQRLDILPEPISRKIDGSPIAERNSLRFHWGSSSSCFQSDYPSSLAHRDGGTMTSFPSLVVPLGDSLIHLLCFISISSKAANSRKPLKLSAYSDPGIEIPGLSQTYFQNKCGVIEFPAPSVSKIKFFGSADSSGVPIFITKSYFGGQHFISVEHTHPPHELFWRNPAISTCVPKLKSTWLNKRQCPQ